MAGAVVIEGMAEFLTDLRAAPRRIQTLTRNAFRVAASRVTARAATYAPRRTGDLASRTSVRVTPNRVTITWLQPYASVQEWATDYQRGGPRPGPVHMSGREPPRFAYRAQNELADSIGEAILDAVIEAVAEGGWWEVVG